MGEWKEYKLGEIISLGNGKVRPKEIGNIPIYGGNGILGYCNNYNYKGETIIIGRVGAYCGSVYYENRPIWISDNALAVKPKNGYSTKFLYYFLKTLRLHEYAEGSSHPLLTQTLLNTIDVLFINNIQEQNHIASILGSLDNKIDLLHRENETLEAMAETLFRKWFIEDAKDEWEEKSLACVSDITAGGDKPKIFSKYITSECTIPVYSNGIDNEGLYGYTNIPKIYKESITVSARGTIGYVVLRRSPYVPIVRLISLIPKDNIVTAKWLYLYLKQLNINGTGTTQQQLTIPDFCSRTIILPPFEIIKKFTNIIDNLYDKQLINKEEISCIEKMKNCLLKKLMHNK